jgi:hypothetical protein
MISVCWADNLSFSSFSIEVLRKVILLRIVLEIVEGRVKAIGIGWQFKFNLIAKSSCINSRLGIYSIGNTHLYLGLLWFKFYVVIIAIKISIDIKEKVIALLEID